MIHLMFMHALYSSPLLENVSCWTLGNCGTCYLQDQRDTVLWVFGVQWPRANLLNVLSLFLLWPRFYMCELFGVVDRRRAVPCTLGVKDELTPWAETEYSRNDIFTRGSVSQSKREQSCRLVQGLFCGPVL